MPTNKDTSPNIKWKLPEGEPAFSRTNIFPEEMLREVKELIAEQANWGPGSEDSDNPAQYHTIVGRWVTEILLPESIRSHIQKVAEQSWSKKDLKLKNIWFARYQRYNGVTPYLWEHMDQPGTQYTMDVCIESKNIDSWGLIVDGETFSEAENSAVFFMGQQQTHSRPKYPTEDPDAYVVVMFALFVSPEHWMYDYDAYAPEQDEELREKMALYKLDGDIRYYEHVGHSPRFEGLPEGNYECNGGLCEQCNVVSENFVDDIPGYIHLS